MPEFSWRRDALAALVDTKDYRQRAQRRLPRMVFDYIDGAAGAEQTALRNRHALDALQLQADVLRDVAEVDIGCELFGQRVAMPVIIGPTGLNGAYWPQGDLCLARAADAAGIPFVMSTAACVTLDTLVQAAGPLRWFQLYMLKDRALAQDLLARVWEAGFELLELTVDTPVGGRRHRDARNGFSMPFHWTPAKLWDVLGHPHWAWQMLCAGTPTLRLFEEVVGPTPTGRTISEVMNQQISASFSWQDLDWLRSVWPGALVLKGVNSGAQCRQALQAGVDGVVVSNHGGRQLDGAPASIENLRDVLQQVGGQMAVLVDSGFRSGTDVVKALTLGAQAVQLGRSALYALAAGGQAGVGQLLATMAAEIRTTLALMGHTQWPPCGPAQPKT